jgi:uncharacterized RDD family membrane protein YckC
MNKNIISTKSNLKKRFFAGLFDYSTIFIVTYLIFDIWGVANSEGNTHVTGFPAFCIFLFWCIWTVGLEQIFGATLGNSIFNLKPISTRKKQLKLTLGQSIKRHLLDSIDLSPIGIGVLLIKNTENNQRLGDIWAETIVIDETDQNQSVKKFDDSPVTENYNIQKKNIGNYIVRRVASALFDFIVFAIILKILLPYIGNKIDGEYYTDTFPTIIAFFFYLLIQDLFFKKTLGKFIFKLEFKLLEDENKTKSNKYFRISARRVFDVFEIICPFIYLISISITDKNQKLGDKITKIIVTESKIKTNANS